MKLSRILALLLSFVMIISLFACDTNKNNGDGDSTETKTEANTNATTETDPVTDPATDPVTEPATDPATDPVTEPETEPVTPPTPGEVRVITIAEALELCGEPGNITEERYEIRATIKTIINAQYGEMTVYDETGEIYVYGTYSADGSTSYGDMANKPYTGDEVVLHCILQNYNGTKEVKNARLIGFKSNQVNVDVPTQAPETDPVTESETEPVTPPTPGEVRVITIAEALELCGEPGNITEERYEIRATIKTIINAQYGEMVIFDETGEIAVYGTYSADGSTSYGEMANKPYKGDEVVLHCILQNYNGTKEVKNARLIEFKSNQVNVDVSAYAPATIAEARDAEIGAKLRVSGVVARITYANGMKPSGFILVNGADSIYVYDGDAAARVEIGNKVEIAASKTYWILDSEQQNAETHGYKGCNQLESVILISNDEGNNEWISASFPTATVKELMDNPVSNDITTQIYKVTALVKKVPGNGFTNYYIDDLDETTGSYAYTQCSGSDFAWLDEFDGKICTVYLVVLNAKSSVSGCVYRFLPIAVVDEQFVFNTDNAAEHAVKYYGVDQFEKNYTGDPALELITSVSSELLGFTNATLSYTSSDESIVKINVVDGKTVMNCLANGTATITITGEYNGKTYTASESVTVDMPVEEIPSISVGEAINAAIGTEVTVKGIVGPSIVNQSGFYLIDDSGVIAVILSDEELAKVQLGNEVILKGTRAIRLKDGSTVFGQTNLDACEILVNNYGSHDYSTATFIEGKTAADFYALSANEDHGTEVYVLKVTVEVVETTYYTNMKLNSGGTSISLYCSSANQYNWLKAYAGQEITVEIAPCNWNAKTYYAGCVLAVRNADGTKTCNELNFSK